MVFVTRRSPRQLIEGEGAIEAIGTLSSQLGRRALVVVDPVIAAQPGYERIVASLDAAGVTHEAFVDVEPEVPIGVVADAVAAAERFEPDHMLAIGGGSVIDLAKATGAVLAHGGSPRDYVGENLVPGPIPPLIAVPTTAGTGSEVTPVAVLSDPDRALKVGLSSVHLVPAFAICDPLMTHGCPPSVTAFAGIDAVCHAVEAYTATVRSIGWREVVEGVSVGKNPVGDRYAREALQELIPNLPRVVDDGEDRAARASVMRGATAAGISFGHAGVGGPHALQYPIGALTKTPHGLGVGLLLPYVLTANRPAVDQELGELATCVGLEAHDPADAFIVMIVELLERIGVPTSLQAIGVERSQLRELAELASGVTRLLQNDRGDTSVDGLERVLDAAWQGDRGVLV